MHTIKVNRALAQAEIGRNPASATHMLDYVPEALVAGLTARQLAAVLDTMWRACQDAKAIAARDAIAEGGIWDERRQTLRPLAA